jgi:hypothetical protein
MPREDVLPVGQIYLQLQHARDETAWQNLVGTVPVDLSEAGLQKSAEGAAKLPTGKEKVPEAAPVANPFREGLSTVLKTMTGYGVDELEKAVQEGTLPEKVSLRLNQPIANVGEALVRSASTRAGAPAELTEQLAESVRNPIGTAVHEVANRAAQGLGLDTPTATKVAAVAGTIAAVLATPSAMGVLSSEERLAKLKTILTSERGSIGFPPEPTTGRTPITPKAPGEARVNVGRIDATASVKKTIQNINAFQAERTAPSRVPVTHAQTVAESQGALTLEHALSLDPESTMLDRAQMTALRDHYNKAATYVDDLAKRTIQGDAEASADLVNAFTVAGELAVRDEMIARNVARGLEARKILSSAERSAMNLGDIADLSRTLSTAPEIDPGTLAERLTQLRTKAQKEMFAEQTVSGLRAGQNMIYEAWINSLLSGPQTHAANTLSNAGTALWSIPERWLAQNLHFGSDPGVVRGEATAMLRGLVDGFGDGLRLTGKALREGDVSVFGVEKVERPPAITASGAGVATDSMLGRAIDFLGNVVRMPTRLLTAEDAMFKAVNYRMELKAQAVREATLEGLTGDAFGRRVADLERNPSPNIKTAAEQFALIQTFNNALGPSGQALMRFVDSTPGGRLVMPFVRTPINILNYTWQRLPGLNLLSEKMRSDLATPGAQRDLALGRFSAGLMASATVAILAAQGLITGGGPKDKNLVRELRETGWQPYSIDVGETYYAYSRLDPLGALIGITADASEILGQLPEDDALSIASALGLAVSKHMVSKTYLEGLSNVLEAIQKPDEGAHTYAKGFVRSLVPGLVRQIERQLDPTVRETRTLLDEIKAAVPGWSATLPPRRNLFAEPIRLQGGWGPDLISPIYTSTIKDDPVRNEIVQNRVALSMPSRFVAGPAQPASGVQIYQPLRAPGLELTLQEYDRYVVLMGKEVKDGNGRNLHEALEAMMRTPEYQRQSPGSEGGKAGLIKTVVNTYKEIALLRLRQELPELDQDLKAHQMRQLEKKLPIDNPRSPHFGVAPGTLTR